LCRRVALGVEIYGESAAPLLVMSGGGRGPVPEAEAMADIARLAGVPQAALICESRSRDTVENALLTARLLRERGLGRVILVSGRAHLWRARLIFRLAGLAVVGLAPVPPRSRLHAAAAMLRNLAALPRSLVHVLVRR
jgi:uncharacterized SAM-binding protein YcdF (DUF218 family)